MTTGIDLMRHALGVQQYHGPRFSKPYRNYFVAGDDDAPAWEALVAALPALLDAVEAAREWHMGPEGWCVVTPPCDSCAACRLRAALARLSP